MPRQILRQPVIKKLQPVSELQLYFKVLVSGLIVFGLSYFYTSLQHIPNPLNKAVADTSVILMGLSMLLSSICYFWNFFDSKIIYRKHLGLIGFAFGLVHIALSFSALQRLFQIETWHQNAFGPALTGLVAAAIFALMTLVSNRFAASHLGGKTWRMILRLGYVAILLVLAHVVLLKSARWLTWYKSGMETLPSMSLLVSAFIGVVVVMRILLWWSLKRASKSK